MPSFGDLEYWKVRYSRTNGTFDWYGSYAFFKSYLTRLVQTSDKVLVPGCGNAHFSFDLYKDGFENLINVDYEPTVIANMKQKALMHGYEKLEFRVLDCVEMNDDDKNENRDAFDVVLDKATVDAICCGSEENAMRYVSNMQKLLKSSGKMVVISYSGERGVLFSSAEWKQVETIAIELPKENEYAPTIYHHIYIAYPNK